MKRQQSLVISMFVLLAGATAVGGMAAAQDTMPKSTTTAQEMKHEDMKSSVAMGMHDMPATVTEVDHKTGMVDVDSMNMKLKVHFPANSVADLKKGDKITLHLGFSKQ